MIFKRVEKSTGSNILVDRKRPSESPSCFQNMVLNSSVPKVTPPSSTFSESGNSSESREKGKETEALSKKASEKCSKVSEILVIDSRITKFVIHLQFGCSGYFFSTLSYIIRDPIILFTYYQKVLMVQNLGQEA